MASVTGILAKANVNIEGISVAESTDTALVQIIVDNEKAAKKALDGAKLSYTAQNVSVIVLPHRAGALAGLATLLAKARISINYIYATAADDDKQCCLVISSSDLDKVEKIASSLR